MTKLGNVNTRYERQQITNEASAAAESVKKMSPETRSRIEDAVQGGPPRQIAETASHLDNLLLDRGAAELTELANQYHQHLQSDAGATTGAALGQRVGDMRAALQDVEDSGGTRALAQQIIESVEKSGGELIDLKNLVARFTLLAQLDQALDRGTYHDQVGDMAPDFEQGLERLLLLTELSRGRTLAMASPQVQKKLAQGLDGIRDTVATLATQLGETLAKNAYEPLLKQEK